MNVDHGPGPWFQHLQNFHHHHQHHQLRLFVYRSVINGKYLVANYPQIVSGL